MILPGMAEHRYVPGCPHCEAQRRGEMTIDPPTPPDWVYATRHLLYARYYASRAVLGTLYAVEPIGPVEVSTEDQIPTVRARALRVVRVMERSVMLTMDERRRIFRELGGTDAEFDAMIDVLMIEAEAREK